MKKFLALMCMLSLVDVSALRTVPRMSAPGLDDAGSLVRRLGRGAAALSLAVAVQCQGPQLSLADAPLKSGLETSIVSLESASTRKDVIQALADVFEAAESKTLLVRTKYKYRIINAINEKHVMLGNEWDQPLSYESNEVKRRVDPYRTVDLKGYLQVAPFVGGAGYLGALFVQQALPELFVFAYPAAVVAFVFPIIFIILTT